MVGPSNYEHHASVESAIAPWPVASTLSQYLPAGDLISLARANSKLRASLHGFEWPLDSASTGYQAAPGVRDFLHIGLHNTAYWQRLKEASPFLCSSKTHTKGPEPRPCRYCSRPICEACIVRSSFARRNENTFKNRCRFLCKPCWDSGQGSKSTRLPLNPSVLKTRHQSWYNTDGSTKDCCICTLKNDGWICLDCKDKQNTEATEDDALHCHAEGCSNDIGEDFERRRICLWCDKRLPRPVGSTTRYVWSQKMIEARARNVASRQADMEEYAWKRLKADRMSRRNMRGDEAVLDDSEADLPQFVRHLDTINYRQFLPEYASPNGGDVYASKRGFWRYNKDFLLGIGKVCVNVSTSTDVALATLDGSSSFARTNAFKRGDWQNFQASWRTETAPGSSRIKHARTHITTSRLREWHNLKVVVFDLLMTRRLLFDELRCVLKEEYDLDADLPEYRMILTLWDLSFSDLQLLNPRNMKYVDDIDTTTDQDLVLTRTIQEALDREAAEALQAEWAVKHEGHSGNLRDEEERSREESYSNQDQEQDRETSSAQFSQGDKQLSSSNPSTPSAFYVTPNPEPESPQLALLWAASDKLTTLPTSSHVQAGNGPSIPHARFNAPSTLAQPPTMEAPADDPPPYKAGDWVWHDDKLLTFPEIAETEAAGPAIGQEDDGELWTDPESPGIAKGKGKEEVR